MSKVCAITGKRPLVGNKVSHSNRKSKKRSMPNLVSKRFWVPSEGRYVRLKLSAAALRDVDKLGIEAVLSRLQSQG